MGFSYETLNDTRLKIAAKDLEKGLKNMMSITKTGINSMVSKVKSGFKETEAEAKKSVNTIKKSSSDLSSSVKKNLTKGIKSIAGLFDFGMKNFKEYIKNMLMGNEQFSKSLSGLKSNLKAAFQPIFDFILPGINALMSSLEKMAGNAAGFTTLLFGDESKIDIGIIEEPGGLENIKNLLSSMKDALAPVVESIKKLGEELQKLGTFAWEGLLGFYENFLKPIGAWIMGEGLPGFVDILTEGFSNIQWDVINEPLSKLWEILTPFALNVGEGLLWFWENVLVPLGTWTMNEVVPKFLSGLSSAIGLLNAAINVLKPAALFLWDNLLLPIAQWTGGVIIDVLDLLGETFDKLTKWIKENGDEINTVLTAIGTVLSAVWQSTLEPILTALWSLFKKVFGDVVNVVLNATSGIITALAGVIEFIAGAFTGDFGRAWDGVKQIFSGVFNTITAIVGAAMNLIIDSVNLLLKQLNKISFSIPDWIPVIGGNSWGFSISLLSNIPVPKIKLAKGGLAYGQVQAVVGDNFNARQNPEVIAPLSNLQNMITAAILQRDVSGGGNSKVELHLTLEDGTPLVEALIDPMNRTAKKLGYRAVFSPV